MTPLMCVCVTDISNTTSEVSANAAGATYNGIRDDHHVAVLDGLRRPFHLSALPGTSYTVMLHATGLSLADCIEDL